MQLNHICRILILGLVSIYSTSTTCKEPDQDARGGKTSFKFTFLKADGTPWPSQGERAIAWSPERVPEPNKNPEAEKMVRAVFGPDNKEIALVKMGYKRMLAYEGVFTNYIPASEKASVFYFSMGA
ncbi:hypothetical protein BT96DRAFT_933972 [Gymnopus androsaceus JB14]|uniref:Uncharacterized protein n=1 Tax=Gymnopus androsaceus JB14 TaxID=1447944 RepID=A0A6A4I880_9AGAR|nr:hypothetical protein BT96DRAFT_933972 [Gymnopus androsaceus JB14]